MPAPRNHYRIAFKQPHAHLIDVEARFHEVSGPAAVVRMAAWTPGSYLVRDHARHVQDLVAEGEDGRPLAVTKVDKAGWRVDLRGARDLVVRYRVYAHELTVRTNHVDGGHAFVNGAPTYLWLDERRGEPHAVDVEAPAGWKVVPADRFVAADLDDLIDSPFHAGPGPVLELDAAGRPLTLAVWGRPDDTAVSLEQLAADSARIVGVQAKLFGGVPYDRYAFLLLLAPGAHGGLEHRRSSALLADPFAFANRNKYEDLLELVSHEFFHLWNVKRIRPRALGPFDYTKENHTRALWVVEGVTSYYDRLFLRRARLQPIRRYLEKLAEEWGALLAVAGRHKQSLEEASFDAWIKLYRPDENTGNSTVSYYLKGSLVALALDLEIRRRSAGRRSLDDAMTHLWREFGQKDRGYEDLEVGAEIARAVDLDLDGFFARCVRGREDPDLAGCLRALGHTMRIRPGTEGEDRPSAWLGVTTRAEAGRSLVASVAAGGPAERAGLYAGDEIVALAGYRTDERTLLERIATRRPGERLRVTVFRREELTEVEVLLGEKPPVWEVIPSPDASDAEKALGRAWLGEE